MSQISVHVSFALENCEDFDLEINQVIDEVFDLEAASDEVWDAGASTNSKEKTAHISLFAETEDAQIAVAKCMQLINEAIASKAKASWVWQLTDAMPDHLAATGEPRRLKVA